MSHWTVARMKIRNPRLDVLRRALEVLAAELGSTVAENFVVYGFRHSQRCQLAVPMRLPYGNGYGVVIDENGEIRVVVDDHGAPLRAEEFAAKLQQYYIALAVAAAAQQLGFQVSMSQAPNAIILDLTRW